MSFVCCSIIKQTHDSVSGEPVKSEYLSADITGFIEYRTFHELMSRIFCMCDIPKNYWDSLSVCEEYRSCVEFAKTILINGAECAVTYMTMIYENGEPIDRVKLNKYIDAVVSR